MDILKELEGNQTILLLVSPTDYNTAVSGIAGSLSGKSVCYITLNKTYTALKETFAKKGVDTKKFIFIDCITKSLRDAEDEPGKCYYVDSPSSLTELSIRIEKVISKGVEFVVFDSIANLLPYQDKNMVIKFFSSTVNKIRGTKSKAVFYSLQSKEYDVIVQQAGTFVDKVIDSEI